MSLQYECRHLSESQGWPQLPPLILPLPEGQKVTVHFLHVGGGPQPRPLDWPGPCGDTATANNLHKFLAEVIITTQERCESLNEVCCSFEFGLPQRHTTCDHWCTPEVCNLRATHRQPVWSWLPPAQLRSQLHPAPTVSTAIDLRSGCSSPAIVQAQAAATLREVAATHCMPAWRWHCNAIVVRVWRC